MAFTELERANIRKYLGFPSLFKQFQPRLENAMNSVQSVADGGQMPTADTENNIRLVLTQLANVDTQLVNMQGLLFVVDAGSDKVSINPTKAMFMLKIEGRRIISQLSIPLGCKALSDYYGSTRYATGFEGDSFFPTDLG